MDQHIERMAPYFDSALMRTELTALAHEHAKSESKLRSLVVDQLKDLVADAREQARLGLMRDNDGMRCAEGLSAFQDELIRVIYDFTVHHVYRAKNPSSAERMAVVATGGYGRGKLAPGSDIDLLFLLPYKQTPWGESVVENMLYMLWDLGFKVGHATRSADQCIKLSKEDFTIRTAILDARLIWGDEGLFEELRERFNDEVVKGSGREFVDAKLAEREERMKRTGESRYKVEPNIKEGKGGLRDLHILHWLAVYLTDFGDDKNLVEAGVFTPREYHTFRKAQDFLWTVRCHLHFLTGRPEERLTFDVQPAMAELLGYQEHAGLMAVERFMRHYFLTVKDVGDLTRTICAELELKQLKSTPQFRKILAGLPWRRQAQLTGSDSFRIENGRLNVASRDVFKNDPVNLIRLFQLAEEHDVDFHPEAMRLVRASIRLITPEVRRNPEANEIFLKLVTSKSNPERALRRMNEAGVLGRFIPDFGRIVSMMQFNMYHHYTVDEHLLFSVGILNRIERGKREEEHPLSTKLIHTIKNRRALYVAVFIHDIAKGRPEDHSIAGARIARTLCPRLGLSEEETDIVSWLVEHHLDMSLFAQSRDVNDPKTISDFADIVKNMERLKLLLILTVSDISAVGPGVWNGWKGQLLRVLYYETERLISDEHEEQSDADMVVAAQETLKKQLTSLDEKAVNRFIERQYQNYWLRTDLERQIQHAEIIAKAEEQGDEVVTSVSSDAFRDVTSLNVYAPGNPNLLAIITGACAVAGGNIVDAQITTTRDGKALDTICLQREFDREEDEMRRANRIIELIDKQMNSGDGQPSFCPVVRPQSGRLKAFKHAPEISVDNALSDDFSVIEVRGKDRPGLLYDLTMALSKLKVDINSAHVATFGEEAVDVFYVVDASGGKIADTERHKAIAKTVSEVFDEA